MDQEIPTEASAEVGTLIHPQRLMFFNQNSTLSLDYFDYRTYNSICLRLKQPPGLFRNQHTSKITPLQRYKPET